MIYKCIYIEPEKDIFTNKQDKKVIEYLSEKIFNKAKNEIILDSKYGTLLDNYNYQISINILSDKRLKDLLEKEELLNKILNKTKEIYENKTIS